MFHTISFISNNVMQTSGESFLHSPFLIYYCALTGGSLQILKCVYSRKIDSLAKDYINEYYSLYLTVSSSHFQRLSSQYGFKS